MTDDLRLCEDSPTLDKLVCWTTDGEFARMLMELLGEHGVPARAVVEHDGTRVLVATADLTAACAATNGLTYGLIERADEVRQLRDIIQRLYDFAPPAPYAHYRDAAQYAVALRDAERVLPKKGGA